MFKKGYLDFYMAALLFSSNMLSFYGLEATTNRSFEEVSHMDINGAVALVICTAIVLCGVVIIIVTGRSKRK